MNVKRFVTLSRRWSPGDDGSLPLAMLLTIVGMGLSTLLASMVLVQLRNTRADVQRADALHAARAGVQVAVAQIRQARDASGAGDLAGLPCHTRRPGDVGGGGGAAFETTIEYFLSDPARSTGTPMACPVARTPRFARITSLGRIGTGVSRELTVTYTFRTTNEQIPGGLLYAEQLPSSPNLCIDAGQDFATEPDIYVTMQQCLPGDPRQTWAYHRNLSLVLVASTASGLGKCLDAPPQLGARVKLEPCAAKTATRQQWSFNDHAAFEGALPDGSDNNGLCFSMDSRSQGAGLSLSGECGIRSPLRRFEPETTVGAGRAGAPSGQLVNFGQFGRCLDVSEFNVAKTHHVVWPCKQNPNSMEVGWNQRWTTPTVVPGAAGATGTIRTTRPDNAVYCLKSPGVTGYRQYVTVQGCPGGAATDDTRWTIYGDTGVPATAYRVVDSSGRNCLQAADQKWQPPDLYEEGADVAKPVLMPCSDSPLQKWNAPPMITSSPLKDLREK